MPQSKNPPVFVESGRTATPGSCRVVTEALADYLLSLSFVLLLYPRAKILDFGHRNALDMAVVSISLDTSSAEPVWLAEGFP